MREIKFRAWAKQSAEHEMYYFQLGTVYVDDYRTYIQCDGDTVLKQCRLRDNDCVVMQYTGLKDKNGKEIYEGDIVEVEDGVGVIEWNAHDLAWDLSGPNMPITRSMSAKVIGNIYENPELLKIQ